MKRNLLILLLIGMLILSITSCDLFPKLPDSGNNGPSTDGPGTDEPSTDDPGTDDPGTDTPPQGDAATVVDLEISGMKTALAFGEELSLDGLTVTATMSDGTKKALTYNEFAVTCEDFDSMKVGTYTVNVKANGSDATKEYSVTVSPASKLKVLMIGNSYADDTINYAYEIAKASGIPAENILIADIYIGGCTLDTHWNNAQSNAAVYRFGLEREGWFDGSSYQNWTMEQAIKYADWDFITLQQGSAVSGVADSYSNLQHLIDYVLDVATDTYNNPNANPDVKLIWHQTWAYKQGSSNSGFSNYSYDQTTMYNAIVDCLKTQVLPKGFAAVIPNGTAIQNARTSTIGDNLTRDEYDHLSYDAGRYIASLGLVGVLTGRDLSDMSWKPADSGFDITLNNEKIEICKESFTNALNSPYEVTYSSFVPGNIFSVFEGRGTKDNPYLIQSAEDMWKLSEITAGQSVGDKNLYFKLTADIDLGAESWTPICSSAEIGWVADANSFNGNFDGNGHTVTFVGNYTGDTWAKGLFSAVGGYVHDLTLRGDITIEKGRVGSLASMAMSGAKIENVTSYVNITAGNNQVGGIIGYIAAPDVKIIGCTNYGAITGRELVGGIVGGSWQNVSYIGCTNHGEITATSTTAGGIVAEKYSSASLTSCTNDGKVQGGSIVATSDVGSASAYAGNLVGREY